MADDVIVFLDLETTGLNTRKAGILEVGAVATTTELEVLDDFEMLCWPSGLTAAPASYMTPKVQQMHRDNGLLAELEAAGDSLASMAEVDEALLRWLDDKPAGPSARRVLAGSGSERFDRQLMETWLPRSVAALHYAGADVSPVRMMAGWWAPELAARVVAARDGNERPHRALDDAYCARAQAWVLREAFLSLC